MNLFIYYICKEEIDRDVNEALNIRDYGIRFNPVNAKVVNIYDMKFKSLNIK